jgi:hypothetical protein
VRAQVRARRIGVLALSADYPRFDEWRAFADEMARRGFREDATSSTSTATRVS